MILQRTFRQEQIAESKVTLNRISDRIREYVLTEDKIRLTEIIFDEKKSSFKIDYIVILNEKNKVLAHTFLSDFPAGIAFFDKTAKNKDHIFFNYEDKNILSVNQLIYTGLYETGAIEIGYNFGRTQKDFLNTFYLLVFLTIIIILLLNFIFSKALIRPLVEVRNVAIEISQKGGFKKRIKVNSKDEIGQLASAFNEMTEKLQVSYASLEQKVEDRTKELNKTVEQLGERNKEMEGNKEVMLNLLEDLDAEKKLVEEKVKKRTAQLSEEKYKLETITQNVGIGAILLNKEGKVLFENEDVRILVGAGRGKDEILENLKIKFPDVNIEAHIRQCVAGKPLTISEAHAGGSIFEIAFRCVHGSQVGIFAHLILVRDVTVAKLLERAKTDFVAITSHELRTPLTIIRGSAERLLKLFAKKKADEDTVGLVGDIREESMRLLQIVNDFLDITALEEKKVQFKKERFDLAALVKETLAEFEVKTRQKNLSLAFTPPASLPLVLADRDRTRQIFVNILGNAVQYTDKGGITITIEQSGGLAKVNVTDTGIGISPKQQIPLFQKFQTVGERFIRSREYGSGMGLYISKMIVGFMGGKIALERSEPGVGSTFSFSLPIAP